MDLEAGVHGLDQTYKPDILHDRRIDAPIDRVAEEYEGVVELIRLEEGVQREVDTNAASMRDGAGSLELAEGELGPFVTGVELFHSEIHRIGAVGYGGAHGIQGAGGSEGVRGYFWGTSLHQFNGGRGEAKRSETAMMRQVIPAHRHADWSVRIPHPNKSTAQADNMTLAMSTRRIGTLVV